MVLNGFIYLLIHYIADEDVLRDVRRIVDEPNYIPSDPKDLCGRILFSCYMGTKNSSVETRQRAEALANQIGATFQYVLIDKTVDAVVNDFSSATGRIPQFRAHGGSDRENLALQNVQVRSKKTRPIVTPIRARWE